MVKILVFIKKLPHVTKEYFKDYYETNHAPLARRTFPMFALYKRNFMGDEVFSQDCDIDYDAVTEIWFADETDYQNFLARAQEPEVLAAIRADEANFLISNATRMFRVQECE